MEIYELIKRAKDGDEKATEKIVNNNVNLVWSIVNRIMKNGSNEYEKEDLFQIGMIGLIKAIKKFEIAKEVKFSTYAFPLILGEIKMFLREDGIIKVSRTIKDNAKKINELKERYIREGKGDITIDELEKELTLSKADIILAINSKSDISSINEESNDEMKNDLSVLKELKSKDNIEEEVITKTLFKEMFKKLSNLERQVIILRYLKEEKQIEVGKILNITQVKVSRVEKEALYKLKKLLA